MTGRRAIGATRELACLFRDGTAAGLSDRQLLHRFAAGRDEASFAALVGRHGPMVLGVCRRIVRDRHEAEDAFQAAFLVLARKAGSIRVDDTLGRWLYTVARRIALRADASAARRGRLDPPDERLAAPDDPGGAERRELRSALDEEIGRLPKSYRAVVLLCDLEGLTHREAARRLRWPLGTVKGRLARARGLLRGRLARRGFGLSAGAVAAGLQAEAVSAALLVETVSAAVGFAASRATPAGVFPAAVALAREALGMMHMARIKLAAAGLMAIGVAGIGIGRLPGSLPALAQEPAATAPRPAAIRELDALDREAKVYRDHAEKARREVEKFEDQAARYRKEMDRAEEKLREIDAKRQEAAAGATRLGIARPSPSTRKPEPAADAPARPAIEGMKRAFPDYVVEPPDIISVEVHDALNGRPITGERLVRPDGRISLGVYGDVYVAGLTTAQIKEKVILHLRKSLTDGALGLVKTVGEKPVEVEPKDSTRVSVDIVAYNSKVYYVHGEVVTPGRMHVTGSDTVLDAINFAGGLLPTAAPKSIRLVRPAPPGGCCEQVLPVDLDAIVKRGDASTNYQIIPRDRIVVDRATPPPATGDDAALHRKIEERLDAMTREIESLRRELRDGR